MNEQTPVLSQPIPLLLPPLPKLSDLTREFWEGLLGGWPSQRGGDDSPNVGTKPWN